MMATLVLTTVGAIVGGPIGSAIGAAIGSQIDRAWLTPTRKGARLGDLAVQTSSYGNVLPLLFGTSRVAGTVIWATDLREDMHRSGSAKGGTRTTTYSYSADFAVALSARPILGVGRIWADGNLLRGAGGDWKTETGFRLHLGGEDQAADPLIASAEGIGAAPAHRGLAYAVFEGLQLADFGNRIPSLTFEVIADDGAVRVAAIAAALSGGAVDGSGDGGGAATLDGYAATGSSIRAELEGLAAAFPMPLSDDGATLRIASDAILALAGDELGAHAGSEAAPARLFDRSAAAALPDEVTIAYHDPARDHQAGLQRARRDGIGGRGRAIELAASIGADQAKGLAEAALARAWAGRARRTAHLPWRRLEAKAGTRATLDGATRRVAGWTLEKMALALTLVAEGPDATSLPASAGRAVGGDGGGPPGATVIAILDLPALDEAEATAPQLWLAAAGTGPGWRRAEATRSLDGGASWQAIGRTAPPATIGAAATALDPGPRDLLDRRNTIEIELLHAGMALRSADLDALVGGANAAMLGDEILQFGAATQLSPTRWRLGALLRGRRGSDAAIAGHAAGERFVLLDPATLLALDAPLAAIGTEMRVRAIGPNDDGVAAEAMLDVRGRAVRPPPPVRLTAERAGDGTIRFRWVRRSRAGWTWADGGDAPLGEDAERYRLEITPSAGSARTIDLDAPGYDYGPAEQAADGAAGAGAFAVAVTQGGTRASSLPPATASWSF